MTLRTAGRLIAAVLFVAVLAIVGIGLYTFQQPDAQGSSNDLARPVPPIDLIAGKPESQSIEQLAVTTDRGLWTRVDPLSQKLLYKITWAGLEPESNGVFHMKEPIAWVFRDDRQVRISATEAKIVWPARDREPESGVLRGDVRIELFEGQAPSASQTLQESMHESPGAVVRSDSLNFQATLMELTTADEIHVEAPGFSAHGQGLTMRVSEHTGRLKLFRIDDWKSVRFDPIESKEARAEREQVTHDSVDQSVTSAAPEATVAADTQPANSMEVSNELPEPVRTDFYRATFTGNMKLVQGTRSLDAEQLDVWFKLLDGRLPDDAIAPLEFRNGGALLEPKSGTAAEGAQKDDGPVRSSEPSQDELPIVLTGTGPLEVRPLDAQPEELRADSLHLRVQSPKSNVVTLLDSESGATINCVSLSYGATSRVLSAFGIAGTGVTATIPDLVEIAVGRYDQDLTTGKGRFPGPGVITLLSPGAARNDPDSLTDIRWRGRCEFEFDTSGGHVGAAGHIAPNQITFFEHVEAKSGKQLLRGDQIRLHLSEVEDPHFSNPKVVLNKLEVEGQALAEGGETGRVSADALEVEFSTPYGSREPRPITANARGDVRLVNAEGELRAELVNAELSQTERGGVDWSRVDASIGVYARSTGGVELTASRVVADRPARTIEVLGEPATVSQVQSGKGQSLSASAILVDPIDRHVTVIGSGIASYAGRSNEAPGYDRIIVEWRDRMMYNDLTGQTEIEGNASITAERQDEPELLERHTGRADRITVHRAPYTSEETDQSQRGILQAVLESDPGSGPDDHAQIEMRRMFISANSPETHMLEGLLHLRGEKIVLDAQAKRLLVPGAGVLVIDDRRSEVMQPTTTPNQLTDLPSVRGSTGFWWDGTLVLEESTGRGTMSDNVRVVHLEAESKARTEMVCEKLVATIERPESEQVAPFAPRKLRLDQIQATGAVFVKNGTTELMCDQLEYDTESSLMNASALAGNRVTMFDEAKQNHFVAESVQLNVKTGTWQIQQGSATTSPR